MSTKLLIGQAPFRENPDDKTTAECTPVEEVQAAEIDKELAAIADSENHMVNYKSEIIFCFVSRFRSHASLFPFCRMIMIYNVNFYNSWIKASYSSIRELV